MLLLLELLSPKKTMETGKISVHGIRGILWSSALMSDSCLGTFVLH